MSFVCGLTVQVVFGLSAVKPSCNVPMTASILLA